MIQIYSSILIDRGGNYMTHMMHKKSSRQPQGRRPLPRITFITAGLFAALMLVIFGSLRTTYASSLDGRPGGNVSDPIVRAVDIAKPAVVRIITKAQATVVVHFQSATGGTSDVTFPENHAKPYQVGTSGSGTFISSHGDILTAD